MGRHVTPSLDYIRKLYAPQDALLSSIDAQLRKLELAIHVGPDEGRLLQLLITLHSVKTIVEIGTLAGYSTLWMARALPPDGHIHTIDRDPEHVQMARHFLDQSEVMDRITILEGDAIAVLPQIAPKGPFDMVFIDADKPGYNTYLDWAEKHIRKGGLIVADNTLLFGTMGLEAPPADMAHSTWEGMRRFNERLADRKKYNATMIPTEEGLSVAIKLF